MTMFDPNTPDVDKKLQEIEDEDLRDFMKGRGYSAKEIEIAIRNTHLNDIMNRLEEALYQTDEIIDILLEDGLEREEIKETLKRRNNKKE